MALLLFCLILTAAASAQIFYMNVERLKSTTSRGALYLHSNGLVQFMSEKNRDVFEVELLNPHTQIMLRLASNIENSPENLLVFALGNQGVVEIGSLKSSLRAKAIIIKQRIVDYRDVRRSIYFNQLQDSADLYLLTLSDRNKIYLNTPQVVNPVDIILKNSAPLTQRMQVKFSGFIQSIKSVSKDLQMFVQISSKEALSWYGQELKIITSLFSKFQIYIDCRVQFISEGFEWVSLQKIEAKIIKTLSGNQRTIEYQISDYSENGNHEGPAILIIRSK